MIYMTDIIKFKLLIFTQMFKQIIFIFKCLYFFFFFVPSDLAIKCISENYNKVIFNGYLLTGYHKIV